MEHFSRTFDIDGMLSDDAKWLSLQIKLPKKVFLDIAKQLDLRQEDWGLFWKEAREAKLKPLEKKLECLILGVEWKLTQEEFEFVEQLLGSPTDEISNCCGASLYGGSSSDHFGMCGECYENCGVVYVWEEGVL